MSKDRTTAPSGLGVRSPGSDVNGTGTNRDWTVIPGETLREALEEREMSQSYLAWATGYSQKHINQIIKGHARISVEAALLLERELGIPARFWLHLQANYDLDVARGLTIVGAAA